METYYKVKNIIEWDMGFNSIEITPYSYLIKDLNFNSKDFKKLTFMLETEFNIIFEDPIYKRVYTISDMCYAINLKVNRLLNRKHIIL